MITMTFYGEKMKMLVSDSGEELHADETNKLMMILNDDPKCL
jgi:hypothetical protein